MPGAIGGQLGQLGTSCTIWLERALLDFNYLFDLFKVRQDLTDGASVSKYVHQLNNQFRIAGLNDDVKMGQKAIMLLEGTAYNWFAVQGNTE